MIMYNRRKRFGYFVFFFEYLGYNCDDLILIFLIVVVFIYIFFMVKVREFIVIYFYNFYFIMRCYDR